MNNSDAFSPNSRNFLLVIDPVPSFALLKTQPAEPAMLAGLSCDSEFVMPMRLIRGNETAITSRPRHLDTAGVCTFVTLEGNKGDSEAGQGEDEV